MRLDVCILKTCLFLSAYQLSITIGLRLSNGNTNLDMEFGIDKTRLSLKLGNVEKLSAEIGMTTGSLSVPENCEGAKSCLFRAKEFSLNITSIDNGWTLSWESPATRIIFQDCINLNGNKTNWFGGPEMWHSQWPIEKVQLKNRHYTTLKTDNAAISERYWLNSLGGFLFVDDRVPLFMEQNSIRNDSICLIGAVKEPYPRRNRVLLKYSIVAASDPKQAHILAVNRFLGKPKGIPAEHIIRKPIWTTWSKYKKAIDQKTVLDFARIISSHGFAGQLEIDDYWETCYGNLAFNTAKFPNVSAMVAELHSMNFTVSLWTHPFVNNECKEITKYGQVNDLFVKSADGDDKTDWWDGNVARYIDFTKSAGRKWFSERLKLLKINHGFDAFKFDAGESDYPPRNPITNGDIEQSPNSLTSTYVRTCAEFGGLIEVRSGWRTQDLPIFVRMLDKDSRWTLENGLHSLITNLIQFNIAGYVFVLPDIIGGNAYGEDPTSELLVRWTQANTFMPSMQFSFLPWEYPASYNTLAIIKKYVSLHEKYSEQIIEAMRESVKSGTPVNPPIWWIDPTNRDAHKVNDQYLLGEKILVAPVVVQGAVKRDVFLPQGIWKDANTGQSYTGPTFLRDYSAPIDVLPHFIKE